MDPLLQQAFEKYQARLTRLGERASQVTPEMREQFFRRETDGKYGFADAQAPTDPPPEKKDVGAVDYLRAGGMGASMGTLDELAGAGAAIVPGGRGYTEARDKVRRDYQTAREAAPKRMLAAELGGGIIGGVATGGLTGVAAKALPLAARALRGAGTGALTGGAAGAGYADKNKLRSGAIGATAGAVLGGTLPVLGAGAKWAGNRVRDAVNPDHAVARAAAPLLPDDAALKMTRQERLSPGTAVPAALSPELPATVRVIGADQAIAKAAQTASKARIAKIDESLREVGAEYEAVLGNRRAPLNLGEGQPNIRKIIVDNSLWPGDETIELKTVQSLRNRLRLRREGLKGSQKHPVTEQIRGLTNWLSQHAPDLKRIDSDYSVLAGAKKAEEVILKHIGQSRKAYASSRVAGIEPGSPGASLPSKGGVIERLFSPDRRARAQAVDRLLLQPGQIPSELTNAGRPGLFGRLTGLLGTGVERAAPWATGRGAGLLFEE